MKRKQVVLWLARLAPLLACLLTGCTMSGNAACNNGGSVCWLESSQSSDPNHGIFFKGGGCSEICEIAASCEGRVEAIVAYQPRPPTENHVKVASNQVSARCVSM